MSKDPSFKENLDDYLPQIRRIVQKISRDKGIVDDLTQECCVRIIEKEHLWKSEKGTMAKWINAIARNLTLKHIQREKKTDPLIEEIPSKPKEEKFSEEHISWVLNQFTTLPDRQREILHLKYFEGMKVTEISKKLNIDHSTVSKQIQSALNTLKKRAKTQGLLGFLFPWNWDLSPNTIGFGKTILIVLGIIGGTGGMVAVDIVPYVIFISAMSLLVVCSKKDRKFLSTSLILMCMFSGTMTHGSAHSHSDPYSTCPLEALFFGLALALIIRAFIKWDLKSRIFKKVILSIALTISGAMFSYASYFSLNPPHFYSPLHIRELNNMRQLGTIIMSYKKMNSHYYPPLDSIENLYTALYLSRRLTVSKLGLRWPAASDIDLMFPVRNHQIDESSKNFAYLIHKNLPSPKELRPFPRKTDKFSSIPMLASKPSNTDGMGTHVLFLDGRVEWFLLTDPRVAGTTDTEFVWNGGTDERDNQRK